MQVRQFTQDDYIMVSKWWESWNWLPVPEMFLSKNGFIVESEGKSICGAWLYSTDSAACWAENYIVDKNADRTLRGQALDTLIEALKAKAKELGFVMMMTSTNNASLIKRLLKAGCQPEYDKKMCNLALVL